MDLAILSMGSEDVDLRNYENAIDSEKSHFIILYIAVGAQYFHVYNNYINSHEIGV